MHKEQDSPFQLKHAKELLPAEEFSQKTLSMLVEEEERHLRKKKVYRFSSISFGVLASAVMLLWISFGGLASTSHSLTEKIHLGTPAENNKIEFFVYHTHSQESFTPEIGVESVDKAHSSEVNITMVGERLSKALTERGVKVLHEKHDFIAELKEKNLNYENSYELSRAYVSEAVEQNKESLAMVLDIHRASQPRKVTTLEYEGEHYGKVAFFVSSNIDNIDEVIKFTEAVNTRIEEKVPGLSRGVFIKNIGSNQSAYNQDLFNRSLSINIGGAENTLEEEYRTADILAEVLAEIHWEK
ncbi:stage II sporulation protein P [Rossellomorea vietnamensis]|uniref:stage II sporulation protein P n=1 Tax=Rossellomorea vietnamensis TaxID=218284 RepID=UPI003CFA522F